MTLVSRLRGRRRPSTRCSPTWFAGAPPTVEPREEGESEAPRRTAATASCSRCRARRGHRPATRASTSSRNRRDFDATRRRPAPSCAGRCDEHLPRDPLAPPPRRPGAAALDLRRTLRAATRTGEITTLARRDRPHRTRPLLLLIDVSGSLRAHTPGLPALRAVVRAGRDVHVRHAADARHRASCARATSTPRWRRAVARPSRTPTAARASAPRCSEFLDTPRYADRARGALTIVLSDGLERGDPALMAASAAARAARPPAAVVDAARLRPRLPAGHPRDGGDPRRPRRPRRRARPPHPPRTGASAAAGLGTTPAHRDPSLEPDMMRPVQHTAAAVAGWLREGRAFVAGLLVEVDGSSPLDVGASVYIDDQGGIEGSITGGCVEGAVAAAAMDDPRADGRAAARHLRDLRRAGRHRRADVRRDRPHLHPRAPRRARATPSLADLEATVDERPAALVTLLDGEQRGREALRRRRAASPARSAAASCSTRTPRARPAACSPRAARRCATSARTARRWAAACASTSPIHAEPPQMVVFGAIDFSSALAPLAKGLGYRVTIADPRSRLPRRRRASPPPPTTEVGWPDKVAGRRRARPARRGPDLHPRPEARRARRAGRARHRRRLHRRARQPQHDRRPQPRACATSGVTDAEIDARLRARAGWTSAPPPSRRPPSPSSPRSSPHRAGRHGHAAAGGRRARSGASARRRAR